MKQLRTADIEYQTGDPVETVTDSGVQFFLQSASLSEAPDPDEGDDRLLITDKLRAHPVDVPAVEGGPAAKRFWLPHYYRNANLIAWSDFERGHTEAQIEAQGWSNRDGGPRTYVPQSHVELNNLGGFRSQTFVLGDNYNHPDAILMRVKMEALTASDESHVSVEYRDGTKRYALTAARNGTLNSFALSAGNSSLGQSGFTGFDPQGDHVWVYFDRVNGISMLYDKNGVMQSYTLNSGFGDDNSASVDNLIHFLVSSHPNSGVGRLYSLYVWGLSSPKSLSSVVVPDAIPGASQVYPSYVAAQAASDDFAEGKKVLLTNGFGLQKNRYMVPAVPGYTMERLRDDQSNPIKFDGPGGDDVISVVANGGALTGMVTTEVVDGSNVLQFSSALGANNIIFSSPDWGDATLFMFEGRMISANPTVSQHSAATMFIDDGSKTVQFTLNRNNNGKVGWTYDFNSIIGNGEKDIADFERIFGLIHRTDPKMCILFDSEGVPFATADFSRALGTANNRFWIGAASQSGNLWQLRRLEAYKLTKIPVV